MRPKKREKLRQDEGKPQYDQIQTDHELFLQAFEKPTQIYRYLRTRNNVSPIFMQRNLSYMKGRSRRKSNTREYVKVDSILEKVQAKQQGTNIENYRQEYMNLTYAGFFDKSLDGVETVDVETILLKMCHKKRKDVSSPLIHMSLGKVRVAVNPELTSSPSKLEAVAIGAENFLQNNGHAVRSYMLLIRVSCREPLLDHGLCNGNAMEIGDEPSVKKRRNHGGVAVTPEHDEADIELSAFYGTELVIYDKHKRCLLTDGEYELALQQIGAKLGSKKHTSWETVLEGNTSGPFEAFKNCPTLKFKLSWNKMPIQGSIDSPKPILQSESYSHQIHYNNHIVDTDIGSNTNSPDRKSHTSPRRRRIFYQFMYNNNTQQQTEARDDTRCPWCSLNCIQTYCLLKHLRTCHARFCFTYTEHPKGARIDVSINDGYDGSYVGNPQDIHSHVGLAFSRSGPVRRTPVTQLLIYRPKKPSFDLDEFSEIENDNTSRQHVEGHNRLYFHTVTVQPLRPEEIDYDSENENDPRWLRQKTSNLIEEFTDVNEGEKEIMKMWNLHIMHYNYIGDCQLPLACTTFLENHGDLIVTRNLGRNLLLHMVNLYDFGLIKADVVYRIQTLLNTYKSKNRDHIKLENCNHTDSITPLPTSSSVPPVQDISSTSHQTGTTWGLSSQTSIIRQCSTT